VSGRVLTSGEIAIARSVFGDTVPYASVRIYNEKFNIFQRQDTTVAPNGNIYTPQGNNNYSNDYSREPSLAFRSHFIHEMTHVWQYHNTNNFQFRAFVEHIVNGTWLGSQSAYLYILSPGTNFGDYGVEQQAEIVRDFYIRREGGSRPLDLNATVKMSEFAAVIGFIPPVNVQLPPERPPNLRCFPAGTLIAMADGSRKPIELIGAGDRVLGFAGHDPFGRLVAGRVSKLFRNVTERWLALTFLDGGTLSATPGHEMLAADGRFARLDQLVSWQADGTGRVTLVGENGALRPARAETIRFSAATAHLYPLADAAALAQGHQTAAQTFGNLALPPVHRDTQRYVIAPQ
jgi:hypothetical protein